MKEKIFNEGGALNSFGVNYNFEGKSFKDEMNYDLFGTTINFCLNRNFFIPDYIKIDVDGIEHLILDGANEFLKNKKIKSISVEINENFKEQFEKNSKRLWKNVTLALNIKNVTTVFFKKIQNFFKSLQLHF